MRFKPFFINYLPLFLFTVLSFTLSANTITVINENGVGINGRTTTFEIEQQKELKPTSLRIDFQKILPLKKEAILNPVAPKDPLEKLNPKVVIDDVVVFLDADIKMEGMMVYNTTTSSPIGQASFLPNYTPG